MLKQLQDYYREHGYDVIVMEEIPFEGFSVLKCKECHPIGDPYTYFDIIANNGEFYNCNFDNIVKINEEMKQS